MSSSEVSAETVLSKLKITSGKILSAISKSFESGLPLGGEADDLAAYYKLPMFFALLNKQELLSSTLTFIFDRFKQTNGDLSSTQEIKSTKPEYTHYWTYFNGWILRAMVKANIKIPVDAREYFEKYNSNGHICTNNDGSTDVLTQAHYGMYYLESNQLSKAEEISLTLIKALKLQENLPDEFYLKLNRQGELIKDFDSSAQLFHSVKNCGEQLYFMTAYPCAFLASYYQQTNDAKVLEAAISYMDHLMECEYTHNSRFSHKTAWAASILYLETLDEKYLNVTNKIVDAFIEKQAKSGLWFEEEGVETAYDQTSELGCWFQEISINIQLAMLKVSQALASQDTDEKKNIEINSSLSF